MYSIERVHYDEQEGISAHTEGGISSTLKEM
jgi:hypothetical protein